jgi:hypothetical protein
LSRWYRRDEVISTAKRLLAAEEWDDLEEHLQMRCLFPLSRHSELPDYLRTESGSPLFPTNLNPRQDLEKWQDAIGVGWQVLEEETGVSQAEIALKRDSEQERDWQEFLRRYEERKARETGA